MAEAMRIALPFSTPRPESALTNMRTSCIAINALLDKEAATEGRRVEDIPLLRVYRDQNAIGDFAAMVRFACTDLQSMVNWRNCTAHKQRLASMDLRNPRAALDKMQVEVRAAGQASRGGSGAVYTSNRAPRSASAVSTDYEGEQTEQTASFFQRKPLLNSATNPQTAAIPLSPYSTPVQKSLTIDALPITPAQQSAEASHNVSDGRASNPPTHSSSLLGPGYLQGYLQHNRAPAMEGHMPQLSGGMNRRSRAGTTNGSPESFENSVARGQPSLGNGNTHPPATSPSYNQLGVPVFGMQRHGFANQQPLVNTAGGFADTSQYGRSHSATYLTVPQTQTPVQSNQPFNIQHYQSSLTPNTSFPAPVQSVYQKIPQAYNQIAAPQNAQRMSRTQIVFVNGLSRVQEVEDEELHPECTRRNPALEARALLETQFIWNNTPRIHTPSDSSSPPPEWQQGLGPHNSLAGSGGQQYGSQRQHDNRQHGNQQHHVNERRHVNQHHPFNQQQQVNQQRHFNQQQHINQQLRVNQRQHVSQQQRVDHKRVNQQHAHQQHAKKQRIDGPEITPMVATPISTVSNRSAPSAAPSSAYPKPSRTLEQLKYERELAIWQEHQAEKEQKERVEQERKKRLKAELLDEQMNGSDILAYRYREYLEIYALDKGERMSIYHTSLLANQIANESDTSDGAMAVRHAKKNWYNYWTVKDKAMVIKLLKDKTESQRSDLKQPSGYQVTAQDIEAMRETVPSYSME